MGVKKCARWDICTSAEDYRNQDLKNSNCATHEEKGSEET
jgi:hypothetical protein